MFYCILWICNTKHFNRKCWYITIIHGLLYRLSTKAWTHPFSYICCYISCLHPHYCHTEFSILSAEDSCWKALPPVQTQNQPVLPCLMAGLIIFTFQYCEHPETDNGLFWIQSRTSPLHRIRLERVKWILLVVSSKMYGNYMYTCLIASCTFNWTGMKFIVFKIC